MKINLILFFIIFTGLLCCISLNLNAQEKDPFLSPFEPRKIVPKKSLEEIKVDKTKVEVEKNPSQLDAVTVQEIKKQLNSNFPDKAELILAEYKKKLGDKELNESDKTILSDFEDQIKNFTKYKEFLKTTRDLMTVQGKILLNNKSNILLINNQPIAEGEDLTDLLKLETTVILYQVKDESFSIRYKDIILSFHIE